MRAVSALGENALLRRGCKSSKILGKYRGATAFDSLGHLAKVAADMTDVL